MNEVWNAPATGSGMTRTPAGGLAASCSSASTAPAATIWPPPLTLAPTRSSSSRAASTVFGVAAHQCGHAGGGERAGGAHRGAADGGQVDRVQDGQHPGERGGGELADRMPGDDGTRRDGQRSAAASRARCHHQRLGDRGVLDLVGAGGGAEPDQIQVSPIGHGRSGLRNAVEFEPGAQHSGLLGSLSGSDDGQHSISQTRSGSLRWCWSPPSRHQEFCRKALTRPVSTHQMKVKRQSVRR